MIQPPVPCFYLFKVEGEVAKSVAEEISPAAAADIQLAAFISGDFDVDINAVKSLDAAITHVKTISLMDDAPSQEVYNPLYVPSTMEKIDEMLLLEPRADNIYFVGMNSNPYTLKTVEVSVGDEQVLAARIEYRPFEIPGYSDIVEQNKNARLN